MVHLGPKKPPLRKGSMADVPRNLMEQVSYYEKIFHLSPNKLREITKHFISELDKGLSKDGGNIPMIPSWVMDYPTGKETGEFLAIDLGGTNLRVVLVDLKGNHEFDTTQSKYKLPSHLRTTSNYMELWDFVAECLKAFLDDQFPDGISTSFPLGFTFSYPASQEKINEGFLQRWTKGFDIPGVEGKDVVIMLQAAIKKLGIPIEVVSLINDTVGTLVASLYSDANTKMGVIFGTGINGAYYDVVSSVGKLKGRLPDDITADSPIVINCEYGSFDNEHLVLPRTKYDILIDEESPRPGQQAFEKMTSGYYLGELLRLIILDLHGKGIILQNTDISKLKVPFCMDASYPARVEDDPFENLDETDTLFNKEFGIETTLQERKLIRKLSEFIGQRAARLSVCGIAAVCQKRGYETAHIAADGSLFNKYPRFASRTAAGLRDIYDWQMSRSEYPIVIVAAEDGSGVGAAVIAALTKKRLSLGQSVGVKKDSLSG